jgi:hypothetical protein
VFDADRRNVTFTHRVIATLSTRVLELKQFTAVTVERRAPLSTVPDKSEVVWYWVRLTGPGAGADVVGLRSITEAEALSKAIGKVLRSARAR